MDVLELHRKMRRKLRQAKYAEAHKDEINKRKRESYDSEKRKALYEAKKEKILESKKMSDRLKQADKVKEAIEEIMENANEVTRETLRNILRDKTHHDLKLRDVYAIHKILTYYPPVRVVDKADEAIFSLRQDTND